MSYSTGNPMIDRIIRRREKLYPDQPLTYGDWVSTAFSYHDWPSEIEQMQGKNFTYRGPNLAKVRRRNQQLLKKSLADKLKTTGLSLNEISPEDLALLEYYGEE